MVLTVVHCAVQVEEERGAFWNHDHCRIRSRRCSLASDVSLIEDKPRLTWQASLRERVPRTTRSEGVVYRMYVFGDDTYILRIFSQKERPSNQYTEQECCRHRCRVRRLCSCWLEFS